ncbi:MAG: GNAT family N-acetyltransferase [Gaiellaceae bacterium]
MHIAAQEDAKAFLAAAGPVLDADEARHNLIYGICSSALETPDVFPEARYWTVIADGGVVAAAIRTPPFNIVVAQPLRSEALPFAARALYDDGVALPGVTGAVPESDAFAAAWTAVAGGVPRVRMRQGIYRARSVATPSGIPGRARPIAAADRELVVEWLQAFEREALHGDTPRPDHEQWFERRLASESSGVALWEDESAVVSMCGYGGATPHGIRIGPVYTPPELRGRGYGRAVTAHATKQQLDNGRDYCFLYTDLSNPTSNRIYMNIGYERVCDSAEYVFENA